MRVLFTWLSISPRCYGVLLPLVFLLVGCGSTFSDPSAPTLSEVRSVSTGATRTYLGVVSGTQVLLGFVLDGVQVRAYVCDGTPSRLATLTEWFAGQVSEGLVQACNPDQAQLTVPFTSQSASGTLTLASGSDYPFSIPQVPAAAQVGFFEGTALIAGQHSHGGWIVLPNRDQRGQFPSPQIPSGKAS